MKIIRLNELEKEKVSMEGARKVSKQVPISKNDGSPNYSFRVFTIDPDGHTPYHTHPFEHLNYVISGKGVLVNAEGVSNEIKAGEFALVLPGEKHQYRNTSSAELFVMICAVPNEYE